MLGNKDTNGRMKIEGRKEEGMEEDKDDERKKDRMTAADKKLVSNLNSN